MNLFSPAARVILGLIVSLFIALRLWNLTAYGLFSDEVFSADTVHRTWPELQHTVIADVVHPPLFYYLSKVWITEGDTLLWMKLFPVLWAILAIVPFVLLCRELRMSAATSNLALVLVAVNEYLISYSQEFRMYSLLLALVIASMWLFARAVNTNGSALWNQTALFGINLLLVYTHYYGWLVVAAEFLFIVLRRRDRGWSFGASIGALLVCFLPWAVAVTEAGYDKGGLGPNLRWNTRPGLKDLFQHYVTLNGPVYNSWRAYATVFSSVLFFAPIALWCGRCFVRPHRADRGEPRRQHGPSIEQLSDRVDPGDETASQDRRDVFLWLTLLAFLPALIAFAASYALPQSIWGARFLIVVSPAYLLLAAGSAAQLRPPALRSIVIALITVWAGLSGALQLTHRDKIDWRKPIAEMVGEQTAAGDNVRIYTTQGVTGTTVNYYLDQLDEHRLQVDYVDDYADINDTHFWIAFIRYRHETSPLPYQIFADRGDRLGPAIESEAAGHKVVFIAVRRGEVPR